MANPHQGHTYRIVSQDAELDRPRVEFEAHSISCAIGMMETLSSLHTVELFEDDCSLGRLRYTGVSGFWIVSGR